MQVEVASVQVDVYAFHGIMPAAVGGRFGIAQAGYGCIELFRWKIDVNVACFPQVGLGVTGGTGAPFEDDRVITA